MKYTKAMIEVVEVKVEDVILTSGGGQNPNCPQQTEPQWD